MEDATAALVDARRRLMASDIFVGPFTMGQLAGFFHHNGESTVGYDALLQSGAKRLVFPPMDVPMNFPPYLSRRARQLGAKHVTWLVKHYQDISSLLEVSDTDQPPLDKELSRLTWVIPEILLAAERRMGVAIMDGLPGEQELLEKLPPTVSYPIVNFLSGFESISIATPVVKTALISNEQTRLLDEILSSRLYESYSRHHAELSDQKDHSEASQRISDSARELVDRYKTGLELRPIAIRVINIASAAASAFLGPGASVVTDIVRPLIENLLTAERSVVVYDLSPLIERTKRGRRMKK